jgi:ATP-dependent DNA helicase DinG
VFTSATLAVGDDFSHFTAQLGLQDAATLQLDSPFDYPNHALMWLPENLPEPSDAEFVDRLLTCGAIAGGQPGQGIPAVYFAPLRVTRLRAARRAGALSLFVQGSSPAACCWSSSGHRAQGAAGPGQFREGWT